MTVRRWEYAEFGYGGAGEQDLREVWFSHRDPWVNRPSDPSETLRDLGDLGFELVTLMRYPKLYEAQLLYQKTFLSSRWSGFSMRMRATSSFYMFKRPLDDSLPDDDVPEPPGVVNVKPVGARSTDY